MNSFEVEGKYVNLFFACQKAQWENYAEEAGNNLDNVDAEIYALLRSSRELQGFSTPKKEVFERILYRGLVDKHPTVAQVRNKLDSMYDAPGLPKNRTSRAEVLGRRMKPLVLELLQRRSELAKELGFSSYPALAMYSEGLSLGEVKQIVQSYLQNNISRARELAQQHNLSWDTWFSDLDNISNIETSYSTDVWIKEVLRELGFSSLAEKLSLVVKNDSISGYVGVLSVPDDVRILVKPSTSLNRVRTLFHEIGHALTHSHNEEKGLFTTWSYTYDETMAVIVEQMCLHLLEEEKKAVAHTVSVLENVRCAISFLFELELWEQPNLAEELYVKHYSQLGIPLPNPCIWAADSFRSIDPMYTYSYVVGAVVAKDTIQYLQENVGKDLTKWGKWLEQNYFFDGRKRSLKEKIADVFSLGL